MRVVACGLLAVLSLGSYSAHAKDWRAKLAGDLVTVADGKMKTERFQVCQVKAPGANKSSLQLRSYAEAPMNLFARVYAHIEAGGKGPAAYSTFADGHNQIAICEAIVASSRSRSWTKVSY